MVSTRKIVVAGVLLFLVALYLVRPGADHLKSRIVTSIGLAIGRSVDASSVNIRLFPQPGFDLGTFVVHDDPQFGAEPVLRAQEVTALVRVSSLLRGRLEIATLSLTEPSLNLVRNPDGRWNLESLVERADRMPTAPTAKTRAEKRPAFPYIEGSHGRINFKIGAEKKPYALTDADFALWQDSENTWGARLKAQPTRTDFNLSDTGILRVTGSWERAAALRQTPLQFTFLWDRAQLGQATKLAYGDDKGWRGALRLDAKLSGTPAQLGIITQAAVEDFRRYDIQGSGPMRLALECTAQYDSIENTISGTNCNAPVGPGNVHLAGSIANPLAARSYDLAIDAQGVPAQSMAELVRHAKLGIPQDLTAAGELNGTLRINGPSLPDTQSLAWTGNGEVTGLRLRSATANADITPNDVQFTVSPGVDGPIVSVKPVKLALGHAAPALLQGRFSRHSYDFELKGSGQLQRLLQTARTVGIPVFQTVADGSADLDLHISGSWAHFTPAEITGKAHLRSVHTRVYSLDAPLNIASADVTLSPGQTDVKNLSASMAGTSWKGSLELPRPCAATLACLVHFDLHADQITSDDWVPLLSAKKQKESWYSFSAAKEPGKFRFAALKAKGTLVADKVVMRHLAMDNLSAQIDMDGGNLGLKDLHARVLGGRHEGEWDFDFTSQPAQYSGTGTLENLELARSSGAVNGAIAGTASGSYRLTASGLSFADFIASAAGTFRLDIANGAFPRFVLPDGAGLRVQHLAAQLSLHSGKFEIQDGSLETASGQYKLSGTTSMSRSLNLKLTRESASGYAITGTLAAPHITPLIAPTAEAALQR